MNRFIVTEGEQINEEDVLKTNKNTYVALARLAAAILGKNTLLSGFACTPSVSPDMHATVGDGEIYEMAETDTTEYGDLPIDTHLILKQGINLDSTQFTFTAPVTVGQSVDYLIEFRLQEDDTDNENRQFYNAAPQVVPTLRKDSAFIKSLAGTPATTGTQVPPTVETGFVPGWVIKVAYGQTAITADDISVHPDAPFINSTLTDALTQAEADARYARISDGMPVAAMLDYAGSTVPTGWLLCDGAAISRTTYAALFAAIGTNWGAGDGSTTFNKPDFRGRTAIGSGTGSGLTARTLGQTGGAETHQLTIPEMPAHHHSYSDAVGAGTIFAGGPNFTNADVTTTDTGGDQAHNNMQPFAVATKIIKY